MKNVLIISCVILAASASAFARPPRRVYYNNTPSHNAPSNQKVYSYTNGIEGTNDQQRCQAEADYMAANNITGHVWGCIGRFEGVGYGSSPNCNTCTPSSGMTLTGDASAQGRNGMWYRVRSWR
jgi:hypothetical protein